MNRLILSITKFISPPYCVACEHLLPEYTVLCHGCVQQLPVLAPETVACGKNTLTVHAFTAYRAPFDSMIQAKLTSRQTPFFQLGFLLSEYLKKNNLVYDMIVPVPLHWQRRLWRGFNQAETLAQEIALNIARFNEKCPSPLALSERSESNGYELRDKVIRALKRHKKTAYQSTLSAPERQENVKDIFALVQNISVENKRILLVDDLYTTGATAQAAAQELYRHGAAQVELLVACKVVG